MQSSSTAEGSTLTPSAKCENATTGLRQGQLWSWAGDELALGGHEHLCLGLGERVVVTACQGEVSGTELRAGSAFETKWMPITMRGELCVSEYCLLSSAGCQDEDRG